MSLVAVMLRVQVSWMMVKMVVMMVRAGHLRVEGSVTGSSGRGSRCVVRRRMRRVQRMERLCEDDSVRGWLDRRPADEDGQAARSSGGKGLQRRQRD